MVLTLHFLIQQLATDEPGCVDACAWSRRAACLPRVEAWKLLERKERGTFVEGKRLHSASQARSPISI
jgi:hypothetical protein